MIKAKTIIRNFQFERPATTSRGTFQSKQVPFILLYHTDDPSSAGIGECSLFPGLSCDDHKGFMDKLQQIIDRINKGDFGSDAALSDWPSINFALETAWKDLRVMGTKVIYPSGFTDGKDSIGINGLIWMGTKEDMIRQIRQKLNDGFTCLKMKIGTLYLEEELDILKFIRSQFTAEEVEVRVDANGAFKFSEALDVLKLLSEYELHSIEQPIAPGHPDKMAEICSLSPIPVALDEELIGKNTLTTRKKLLDTVRPQYLVLKPGLLGGIAASKDWIGMAEERNMGWWVTSSLETNIGLNAIAQWTYTLKKDMYHGLSTGSLFRDNVSSPLYLHGERLYYDPERKWNLSIFEEE